MAQGHTSASTPQLRGCFPTTTTVPNLSGRPVHERERKLRSGSSLSGLSLSKGVGHWAELKVRTSGPVIPARYGGVTLFSFLARICYLCQSPKQNPHTTCSHTLHQPANASDSQTHNDHNERQRAHERPFESITIITPVSPFSRHTTTAHPCALTNPELCRRSYLQDAQAR